MNAQTKKNQRPLTSENGNISSMVLYWAIVCLASVGVGYAFAVKTWLALGIIAGVLVVLAIRKKMLWGIMAVLFLPVIGELYRLPFGQDNGTLISDIAIGIIVLVWAVEKIRTRKKIPETVFNGPLAFFCAVASFSLLIGFSFLKISEVAAGSLYLLRFLEYALLGIVTMDAVKTTKDASRLGPDGVLSKNAQKVLRVMIISAVLIAVAGFIQLIMYPDLGKLEEYGWDPHQNRLVSTWLDPNFIAGFLSYILAVTTGMALYTKNIVKKTGLALIIATLAVALFLTYSRSGYVAAALSLGIIGILKSRKLLIGSIIVFVIALNFLPRAQERVDDLVHSIQSFVFNTNENPDATARLRIISWNQTIDLIEKRPLLGSGYNTLKYVKYDEGFVQNPDVHSASGSDSSLLTILATTGILGLIPFVMLYWNALKLSYRNWQSKTLPPQWRGYGLGIFAGILGLLLHSLFVNSLLFPQILIFFWISLGLLTYRRSR